MLIVGNCQILNYSEQMTDDQLFAFCGINKELRIERDRDHNIIIQPPVGGEKGYFEGLVVYEIESWRRNNNSNGIVLGSSTGFLLPNNAMRSPSVLWISDERWQKIPIDQKEKFLPVVPDFLVEINSYYDKMEELTLKMVEWIENGALLAWLIDPTSQQSSIYRADGSIEIVKGFDKKLSGEDILPGFEFDLEQLKF